MNFKRYILSLSLAVLGLCVNHTIASAAYLNFGLTKTDNTKEVDNVFVDDLTKPGKGDVPIKIDLSQNPPKTEIPEPTAISFFSLGVLGLAANCRRPKHN